MPTHRHTSMSFFLYPSLCALLLLSHTHILYPCCLQLTDSFSQINCTEATRTSSVLPGLMLCIMYLPPVFDCSAKVLVRGEPNVSYICSRYYRAPELIFGATDYTCQIGEYYVRCNSYLHICQVDVRCTSLVSKIVMGYEY